MRLGPGAACALSLLLLSCASAGDPPGGPPDHDPPIIVDATPDSGVTLEQPPDVARITFDEVVNERIAASRPDLDGAIILSPDTGVARVSWHRNQLTVRPHGGFKAGRIYRIELLPVITDLRQNRLKRGRLIVFSTGPPLPSASLRGAIVDWAGGRPGANALIEAVLLPDSLPYRALADSAGSFDLPLLPAGTYLVTGTIDQDGNRRRGPREAFDTVRVTLPDSAAMAFYSFVHDTTAPRIRTAELADSMTVRLTFDRPLDPAVAFDTGMVQVSPSTDTTARLRVLLVTTPAGLDSLRAREAAARQAADTSRARRPPPIPEPAAPAPGAPNAPGAPGAPPTGRSLARDTTPAMRLLERRPPPSDVRLLRMAEPFAADARYVVVLEGARSLSGITGAPTRIPLSVPRRRETPARGRRAPADTTRPAPDTAGVRRDTIRGTRDTIHSTRDTIHLHS